MKSLRRDGVALFYNEAAGTGRPVVLVHGWCCDHTYFAPQFAQFAARGHHVIAPDLRGHGRSDKPHQAYTMEGFADDVAWLCGELKLVRPIVVGHSMGGVIAFAVAMQLPDLPGAVVMLDSAVVRQEATRPAIQRFIDQLGGPNYREVMRDLVAKTLFIDTDDPLRKAQILDAMAQAPQHVMKSAFEGLRDFDPSAAKNLSLPPSLYVAADEPAPRSDIARLRELAPHMLYGQTVGSGHFCQLEVPDQVNAMIDRFLRIALPAA